MSLAKIFTIEKLTQNFFLQHVLPGLTILMVAFAQIYIFLLVPNEIVMGAVQRIFYFHVASATSAYILTGILLLSSLLFLATNNRIWDASAQAAGEVGFLLCSAVLFSGMIWGHAA